MTRDKKERVDIPGLVSQDDRYAGGNQRYTHKSDLVDDETFGPNKLTGDRRQTNPYKTPPNSLTNKSRDVKREKGV
jgi:hypothetical protein